MTVSANDWVKPLLKNATEVAVLCNQGKTVKAGMELVYLLDLLISHYADLNESQQTNIKEMIINLQQCQNNHDFYAIADYLQFELPYILAH